MKIIYINIIFIILIGLTIIPSKSFAGNDQRAGEAGSELLINPWARSTGWGGANSASIRGLEAMFLNVAGTAFTRKTELIFAYTNLIDGADVSVSAFGLTQRIGESSVLGISVTSLSFGESDITTVNNPDGGLGTFSMKYTNIAVSYAKEFSRSIYGGAVVKVLSGGVSNLSTTGVAIDAGIQYVTGDDDQMKFGMSMKNIGPTMKYTGDGISFRSVNPATDVSMTVNHRMEDFELPSLITIGGSYDFYFAEEDSLEMRNHYLTVAGNFTAISFGNDQYAVGAEYKYKYLSLRAGYLYEDGIDNEEDRIISYTGPSFGASVEIPLGKGGSFFSIDYSFKTADPLPGVHTIGAKITL